MFDCPASRNTSMGLRGEAACAVETIASEARNKNAPPVRRAGRDTGKLGAVMFIVKNSLRPALMPHLEAPPAQAAWQLRPSDPPEPNRSPEAPRESARSVSR